MRIWLQMVFAAVLALVAVSVASAGASVSPTVNGNVISWADDGWYQVQRADTYESLCQGGQSCEVPAGTYIVINHTTGERWEGLVVNGGGGPVVDGNVISWADDGWYQVQRADTFESLCQGGRSCEVPAGTYIVINHTTGQRWEGLVVNGGGGPVVDGDEAPMRNPEPKFRQYEDVASGDLNFDALTVEGARPAVGSAADNGGREGDGNFRITCQYSHFASDDPIRAPGEPGQSHLHMFFGKTDTNAFTTRDNVADSGGGTCNGFELNRSAYWVPALLDSQDRAVVPEQILVYYKTTHVTEFGIEPMPQGLTMLGGNTDGTIVPSADSQQVFWSCGSNGRRVSGSKSGTVPECGSEQINATIYFPQCWDGRRDSEGHRSHVHRVEHVTDPCPSSHPLRLPELGILLYYPPQETTAGWRLSSDGAGDPRGSTLHADFIAGWHTPTIELWVDNCLRNEEGSLSGRNCNLGQTGTNRQLARLNGSDSDSWTGGHFVTIP